MDHSYQPQTNIESILQTLRAYAPSQQQLPEARHQSHPFQPHTQPQAPPSANNLEEGEYDPSIYDPSLPLIATSQHLQGPKPPLQHPPPTESLPVPNEKPAITPHTPEPLSTAKIPQMPNPTTITTWPPALRHVTTLTSTSPSFSQRVSHLITTQHTHERQWWAGRESLRQRLLGREEKRRKLDSVLGSLGGHINTSNKGEELSEEQEIGMYDRKVYKACREMIAATVKELGRLEVPFFCVREGLVAGKGQGEGKGRISEEELVELRGRMMTLLEDLCGEE